jgi:NTF2 fold immunity protein of polymorphic toxin system component
MRTILLLMAALVTGVISQDSVAEEVSMSPADFKIVRVAERYIAVHYPEFDSIKNPPILQDKGDVWEVEYQLPDGVIGGTPVVVIDKKTLKVLRSYRTQ